MSENHTFNKFCFTNTTNCSKSQKFKLHNKFLSSFLFK